MDSSAQFYGAVSGVGEITYGASPSLGGGDANSFEAEDLYVGWRSGNSLEGLGENALDFTIGRARYRLGNGMLLWDGASEGGSRGGYWTNARQAFQLAAIARFKPGKYTLEAFYLEKDELPESDSDTALTGLNYEYAFSEDTTVGVTYMDFTANRAVNPTRDGLEVYNLRAYAAPFRNKALSFEAEYAVEDNGLLRDSEAWNALAACQFQGSWMPKLSYRYALFEGNDRTTLANEAFDGLLTGFSDWGAWWQGEIAGEYFVSNSNLISHQLRVHASLSDSIGTGLILYDFLLDKTIVLAGYRSRDQSVAIADPLLDNPAHGTKYYRANVYRLLGAIFLGVGSDDGNLLVLRPKGWKKPDDEKRGKKSAKKLAKKSATKAGKKRTKKPRKKGGKR